MYRYYIDISIYFYISIFVHIVHGLADDKPPNLSGVLHHTGSMSPLSLGRSIALGLCRDGGEILRGDAMELPVATFLFNSFLYRIYTYGTIMIHIYLYVYIHAYVYIYICIVEL